MTNNSLTQPKDEVFECFGRLSKSFSICFTRYLARCKDNQKKIVLFGVTNEEKKTGIVKIMQHSWFPYEFRFFSRPQKITIIAMVLIKGFAYINYMQVIIMQNVMN